MDFNHKPVLLKETINGLNIKANGVYVDGTLGGAGHSIEILKNTNGVLIGIDKDEEALAVAKEKLKNYKNIKLIHGNHDDIKEILKNLGIDKVDGILLDLGVSSYQLDEKNRGFSYINDARLDMRMDKTQKLDAEEIVNTYSEEELAKIIFEYGEEKFSRRIAKNICDERKKSRIDTTLKLVQIIEKSISKNNNGHPAKKTFQALRIEVNNEIKPLYDTIINSVECLNSGGRLCVITFHSLEDRSVKNAFVDLQGKCICPPDLPYCVCGAKSKGRIITKKPIYPSLEEQKENSRCKSAKLRIFEKGRET